jgi:peptide/nickel transport system permease protein
VAADAGVLDGRTATLAQGLAVVRHPLVFAVVRRLLLSLPLIFVVTTLTFFLGSLIPGNITWVILGNPTTSHKPHSEYVALAHQLGVDRPLSAQYWTWLTHAVHGNLGYSLISQQPVTEAITQRFPVTLSLIVGSVLVSVLVGVLLGVVSAVRGGALGRVVDVVAMVGWVLPGFWLAAQLVVVLAIVFPVFPAIGYVPFAQSPGEWFRSLVLPVVALSIAAVGGFAKFTREAMMDALASEYVRMAEANGISYRSIIFRHAFKSASLQVVTQAGMFIIGLLIGTVFVEVVFALPGMGSLIVTGANEHDLPVVQGVAVFFTLITILVNLATDIAYTLLSPKVHVS